jgi:hypothetical protein
MPKLLNALQAIGGQNFAGYVVVVDLPGNARQPIELGAIETALQGGRLSLNNTRQLHTLSTKALNVATAKQPNGEPQATVAPAPKAVQPTIPSINPPPVNTPTTTSNTPLMPQPAQPEINPTTRPLPIAY